MATAMRNTDDGRDRPDTRRRILTESLALFAGQGVAATTTKQIAERLGMSQGILYKHFASKDDIVWEIFSTGYSRYGEAVRAAAAAPGSFADRLERIVRTIAALHDADPELFRFLLLVQHGQLPRLTPEMSNPVDHILAFIDEGMRAGAIPKGDPVLAGAMLIGLVVQPATFKAYGRIERSFGAMADELCAACARLLFGA